jgi:mRNA interferase MazF
MKRGEIRWYTFRPPDKRRPVLLLTRDAVIEQLGEIIAAPVTRTIGALISELRTERWPEARAALLVACGFNTPE